MGMAMVTAKRIIGALCWCLVALGCASEPAGESGGPPAAGSGAGAVSAGASGAGAGTGLPGQSAAQSADRSAASGTSAEPMEAMRSGAGAGAAGVPASTQADAGTVATQDADGEVAADAGPTANADADAAGGDAEPAPASSGTCLRGEGDFEGSGPYAVQTRTVTLPSFGDYTLYYPDPLDEDCLHPLVAWGNGFSVSGGTAYARFNEAAASWGIVVIVSHYSDISINEGNHHRAGIDYLLEQNEEPSSEFFGRLSGRAGVAGHSMGGAGSERAAPHPNVEAIVNMQGTMGDRVPEKPFLCLTGTDDNGAMDGCRLAVDAMTAPAMYANWEGADHISTTLAGGTGSDQYARLYSAWMRCFLADDDAACALFRGGESCPICQEPGWAEIYAHNY